MSKKLIAIILGVALVASSMQAATGAQKIAFSWSTSFTFTYEPGGGLKAGVNPSTSSLNSWAVQVCKERYDFLYAETVGASGRALGKSDPKATKKTSKAVKFGWRMDEYGEREFFVTYACSGSMVVPVTGPSNSYSIKPYIQDYDERNNFKTKSRLYTPTSRSYSIEELNANGWKVTLTTGQTSVGRCCSGNVWGPVPTITKLPDLSFSLTSTQVLQGDDLGDYGAEGKVYVYSISNINALKSEFTDFHVGLNPTGNIHGDTEDEVIASYDSEFGQISIFVPLSSQGSPGSNLKLTSGYRATRFIDWSYTLQSLYVFDPVKLTIKLKSKIEQIKNFNPF